MFSFFFLSLSLQCEFNINFLLRFSNFVFTSYDAQAYGQCLQHFDFKREQLSVCFPGGGALPSGGLLNFLYPIEKQEMKK